jgi:1-acyl-sn-glycerol-3-phosphate acyltransferase
MFTRIKQFGKIITSGFLFGCLGVGGCLCTLILQPVLAVLPGGEAARRRRAERAVRLFFRAFVFGLSKSGILRVETEGLPTEAQLPGSIILANHPSYLDIVILIALLPGTLCVVKEHVWNNFFFGRIVRAAGFIPNLGTDDVLERGRQALASGKSMVIFPEGTRTVAGHPLQFHRGAAHLALRSGATIFPLCITVTPPLLAKGDRWYQVPAPTCVFRITCGEPMRCTGPVPEDALLPRRARELTHALEARYLKELHG